mgnify:CR=1 FL=1
MFAKGQYDEAVVELTEAGRLDGEDARSRGNLSAALIQVRRVDEAIPHLLEAVRLDPYQVSPFPVEVEQYVIAFAYDGHPVPRGGSKNKVFP